MERFKVLISKKFRIEKSNRKSIMAIESRHVYVHYPRIPQIHGFIFIISFYRYFFSFFFWVYYFVDW